MEARTAEAGEAGGVEAEAGRDPAEVGAVEGRPEAENGRVARRAEYTEEARGEEAGAGEIPGAGVDPDELATAPSGSAVAEDQRTQTANPRGAAMTGVRVLMTAPVRARARLPPRNRLPGLWPQILRI